ncbi:MAG: phosphoribosyl-ATP diphosphatase [Clostridiaceae bacterium]|nr:phosphoribosyl-ATP diphosphatase [Clostridiaceae bacterium]
MGQEFGILKEIYDVVTDRKANPKEGSYTNYLFDKGIDKICKKVGEETSEVIIAAKNNSNSELCYEIADLIYHLTVLMVNQGLTWDDICKELQKRR